MSALCFLWCSLFPIQKQISFGLMPIHVSFLGGLIDLGVLCVLSIFWIVVYCPFIGCHVGMAGRTQQGYMAVSSLIRQPCLNFLLAFSSTLFLNHRLVEYAHFNGHAD